MTDIPIKAASAVILCAAFAGCGAMDSTSSPSYHLSASTAPVYTQVNLRPDDARSKLTTTNFQQAGLIPLCTQVRLVEVTGKVAKFRVENSGREYIYVREKHLVAPFHQHLDRIFGTGCNSTKASALSSIDRQGIKEGRALTGMTKQGVIYAIGYPPDHATPSTDSDAWTYWRNRFRRFIVHFSNGRVTTVQN